MLCMKCTKWIHGQCTKWKKVTSALAKGFASRKCEMLLERLNDDVNTVEGFCNLRNAINASGVFETTVVVRT